MITAWVLYPLVLLALCVGLGLLVDALTGRRLPGALIAPLGLAALIAVAQFTTLGAATAELTVPLLLFLAVLGIGFSLPWRFGRPDPLPVAVGLAVFAVFGAPVILSGEPTFAGFIKLDDTATWMTLTDRVMEHGRSLEGLAPSTYRATLDFNLADGYPVGVFLPFGAAQKLVGTDLAWVVQPYMSFLAAMLALGIWQILSPVAERRALRGLVVFLAAQPALLFGYAMWGGVKEIAAAALIALAVAVAPAALRPDGPRSGVLPLALAAAALVGVLSLGGLVWLGPMLLVLAALAWRELEAREALRRAGGFALALAVLVVPVVSSGLIPPTSSPLTDPSAQGNLRGPLDPLQVLGVWPSGDFRFDPDGTVLAAVLIGLALLAAAVGLWAAARRPRSLLLLYATTLLAAAAIVVIGSPWAGAKALATASPVALSLALVGAAELLRIDRLSGAALVAVLAAGVIWSNVLAYGGVSLAPREQLAELEEIGERFAGQGPALMTEYQPYGARHFLRELDAEGASELRSRQVPLRDGGTVEKGHDVDTDELDVDGLFVYRTLVLRRSPLRSRPPSQYGLAWAGETYEVWQRPELLGGLPPRRLPLGGELDPAAVADCAEVRALARRAGAGGGGLAAARAKPVHEASGGRLSVPEPGAYEAWLGGSVRGTVELLVDGREVGEVRHEINNEGGFIALGEVELGEGEHEVELRFGGADLHPGSAGFPRPGTGPLLFSPAGAPLDDVVSAPAGQAERLCGQRWDWIEAVGP